MEIADLVIINKYDQDYKKVCQRLKRVIEGALSLSMSKHHYGGEGITVAPAGNWFCPVELVSAHLNHNVDSIWQRALEF